MSQELQIKGYYQELQDSGFVSTNICCKLGLEFFLSRLLLKDDLSRVVYSKEDIAFRRRIETLGNGSVNNNEYNYVTLDLPFAVYSQSGQYEEDDRGSTQNAGQIILGRYNPDYNLKVKAAAVKVGYSATVFFSRREDVNVASQLLYFEKTPKFPVYYAVEHDFYGHNIAIPVFMTIESFDSNVDYAEKEWLEKSKIFPVKIEFTVRSYQTLIEKVGDDGIQLPIRFSGLYGYNSERETILTQKSILIWANSKWSVNDDNTTESEEYLTEEEKQIVKEQKENMSVAQAAREKADTGMVNYGKGLDIEKTNEMVKMAVEGYFQDDRDCILDEFFQNEEKTTENSITVNWKIKEADIKYFKELSIYIPGIISEIIDDNSITEYSVSGLYPGSKYDCTLIVKSKNNTTLTYKLNLKTKGNPVLGKTLMSNLVGRQFEFSGSKD